MRRADNMPQTIMKPRIPHWPGAAIIGLVAGMTGCGAQIAGIDARVADTQTTLARLEESQQQLHDANEGHAAALDELTNRLAALAATSDRLVEICAAPPPPPAPAPVVPVPTRDAEAPPEAEPKLIVGARERVWVEDLQLALPARIDTGAETASLDARDITPFERDGRPWVRFTIPHPGGEEPLTLERPRVREALVLQSNSEEPERRPVIELGIQIGSVRQLAEFTLSDRSHLDFQVLVGRNILRDVMLVDVSKAHLVPAPKPAKKPEAKPSKKPDSKPEARRDGDAESPLP